MTRPLAPARRPRDRTGTGAVARSRRPSSGLRPLPRQRQWHRHRDCRRARPRAGPLGGRHQRADDYRPLPRTPRDKHVTWATVITSRTAMSSMARTRRLTSCSPPQACSPRPRSGSSSRSSTPSWRKPRGRIHAHGSPGDAVWIVQNNARMLAAPFLLVALGLPQSRLGRRAGWDPHRGRPDRRQHRLCGP